MKRILPLCVVLSGCSYFALAQSQCAQTLRLAQSIYEQGRLQELPDLLKGCIENGFNDEEKVNAYKLLTLTYIYLEEPEKADANMLALLRTDTEFKVNPAVDPAEFVALYKTFRTKPIYRIGGKLGGTASHTSVVSADYANDGNTKQSTGYGFTASLAAEIPLNGKMEHFTLNPELSFQILSHEAANSGGDTATFSPAAESTRWISLPVLLQYGLFENSEKRKDALTHYYVSAGVSANYLLSPSKTISSTREGSAGIDENSIAVDAQRNKFNASAIVAAGFKKKIGKGFLVVEVRYAAGLLPLSDKADTYSNSTLLFDYHYVDGIYKLNTLSLSAGYVINRYHPKKLTSR
jgi:hypothetical protein